MSCLRVKWLGLCGVSLKRLWGCGGARTRIEHRILHGGFERPGSLLIGLLPSVIHWFLWIRRCRAHMEGKADLGKVVCIKIKCLAESLIALEMEVKVQHIYREVN